MHVANVVLAIAEVFVRALRLLLLLLLLLLLIPLLSSKKKARMIAYAMANVFLVLLLS